MRNLSGWHFRSRSQTGKLLSQHTACLLVRWCQSPIRPTSRKRSQQVVYVNYEPWKFMLRARKQNSPSGKMAESSWTGGSWRFKRERFFPDSETVIHWILIRSCQWIDLWTQIVLEELLFQLWFQIKIIYMSIQIIGGVVSRAIQRNGRFCVRLTSRWSSLERSRAPLNFSLKNIPVRLGSFWWRYEEVSLGWMNER